MSTHQWVVVVRPYPDQNVEVIGPFRSLARAEAAQRRVSRLEDKVEPWCQWAPTIERLQTAQDVLEELAKQDPERSE